MPLTCAFGLKSLCYIHFNGEALVLRESAEGSENLLLSKSTLVDCVLLQLYCVLFQPDVMHFQSLASSNYNCSLSKRLIIVYRQHLI